ncbi:hypothetical protein SODALDRAFT_327598 [Sodiomyces alkalinus F11]|uniref:Type 1 phosphatases regulator n=1 Tax=Sodiomyces alkalinus (strain CBS 110278 / VKM F-3762 / F11) TaxID=1314773 RepID=A0A3N2Q9R4_SODAK|nr:hypothetical protein SODALDRAFT_327598 [Sodiomyces alkalinus F11]ROT43398.1 hypothetical protein SODALDRAFT_327598 [Sodiomyces alkalinus F11]
MAAQYQRSPLRSGSPAVAQTQTTATTPRTIETEGQNRLGPPTLRLRGAHTPSQRTVQWAEDVVDNEGLGRKRSKVCCIYHPPKAVDESSDESSSDSSSSDEPDSDCEGGRRRIRSGDGEGKGHRCNGGGHGHDHKGRGRKDCDHGKEGEGKEKRRPSPNAYERLPKPKPRTTGSERSGTTRA